MILAVFIEVIHKAEIHYEKKLDYGSQSDCFSDVMERS